MFKINGMSCKKPLDFDFVIIFYFEGHTLEFHIVVTAAWISSSWKLFDLPSFQVSNVHIKAMDGWLIRILMAMVIFLLNTEYMI